MVRYTPIVLVVGLAGLYLAMGRHSTQPLKDDAPTTVAAEAPSRSESARAARRSRLLPTQAVDGGLGEVAAEARDVAPSAPGTSTARPPEVLEPPPSDGDALEGEEFAEMPRSDTGPLVPTSRGTANPPEDEPARGIEADETASTASPPDDQRWPPPPVQ